MFPHVAFDTEVDRHLKTTEDKRMTNFFRKLQGTSLKKLIKSLLPRRIGDLLYEIVLGSYEPRQLAKVECEIKKWEQKGVVRYEALVGGKLAHRSNLRRDVYLPSQFGYGRYPVFGDCVTKPEYKGLRIYPHMLGYIIGDLQSSNARGKVFGVVAPDNTASIRGIERAGLAYAARLKGIRIGPVVFNRSGQKKQVSESR